MKKEKQLIKPVRAPIAAVAKHRPVTSKPKPKSTAAATVEVKPKSTAAATVEAKPTSCVRLELYAPRAQHVFVAGSFNNWRPAETAMQPGKAGTWTKELALTPGRHEYLFLVDGQWLPDPCAASYAPNPFGGQNSLLEIV